MTRMKPLYVGYALKMSGIMSLTMVLWILNYFDHNGYKPTNDYAALVISTLLRKGVQTVYKLMLQNTGYVLYSFPLLRIEYGTLISPEEVHIYKHDFTLH